MTKIAKNILSLNHDEVMDFFMNSKQYYCFELPKHFVFDKVQKHTRGDIRDTPYKGCVQEASPYTLYIYLSVADKDTESSWKNDWLKAELTSNFTHGSVANCVSLKSNSCDYV